MHGIDTSYWPAQYLARTFPCDGAVNTHFGEEPLLNSKEPPAQTSWESSTVRYRCRSTRASIEKWLPAEIYRATCKWGLTHRTGSRMSRSTNQNWLHYIWTWSQSHAFGWWERFLWGPRLVTFIVAQGEKIYITIHLCPEGGRMKRVHVVQLFFWLVYKKMYSRPWKPNDILFLEWTL